MLLLASLLAASAASGDASSLSTSAGPASNGSSSALGFSSAHPAVLNPEVTFVSASSSAVEADTVVTVDVALSAVAAVDVSIPYSVGGSADGADATVLAGPLVILAGQTMGSIDVTLLDDAASEGRERVILTLGTPAGAVLGATTEHQVVIDDDEAPATLTFDLPNQTALESAGVVPVSLTLSSARTEEVRVSFTQTGTATPGGTDVTTSPVSPIIVPAGATSATLNVAVVQDSIDELDETFVLSLLLPVNAALGATTQHTLTITDDDSPPAISFATPTSTLVETDALGSVVIELSNLSTFDVGFTLTASGSAVAGTDYTFAPASLVIPAGSLTANVEVTPIDDADPEGSEIATLTIGAPTNGTVGAGSSHDVLLIDDDVAAPLVEFTESASSVLEDVGSVTLRVELSDYAATAVSVPITTSGSADGSDFTLLTTVAMIPVGALGADVSLDILDDLVAETDETISVALGVPSGASIGTVVSHVITVQDDDVNVTVDFAVAASSFDEAAGTVMIDVILSGLAPADVTIPFVFSGTAETGGVDVTVASSPLVILAGEVSGQIAVSIESDALFENDESLQFDLGVPVGADPGIELSHLLTITNDDALPIVQFDAYRTVVAESSGGFSVQFILDGPSGLDATVPFTVTGTGSGPADITFVSDPVVIPAGDTSVDLAVTLLPDNIPELGEKILFTMGAPTDAMAGAISSYLVLIQEPPAGPLIALAPALTPSVTAFTFPQTRIGSSSLAQTVFFTNLHSAPVTLTDIELGGPNKEDFQFVYPNGLPVVIDPGQSTPVEVSFVPLTRGPRVARFSSRQALQGQSPPVIELAGFAIGGTGAEILMNASFEGFVSPSRDFWSPEYGFDLGFNASYPTAIAGTTLDDLFRSVRYGPTFSYGLELENGRYAVRILSWEPVKSMPGERLMDVSLEGAIALDDLDLFAEVGKDTAYISPPLMVDVTDGVLDIEFQGVVAQALVSAIEVSSVAVLSTSTTALNFGTVDQGAASSLDVLIQNDGLHGAVLDRLTFRVEGIGGAEDFSIESDGVVYSGEGTTVVRFPSIELPPGQTVVPVTFEPTVHEDNVIALEFESTSTGDLFSVDAFGTGGAQAGWGFLHPVPRPDPSFVVDYDMDGAEAVFLQGTESHTHEPGHFLAAFDWQVAGSPVASTQDTTAVLPVGTSSVSLTIADDNVPAATATDTLSITVHPVDSVPGSLVEYYDGSVAGEVALLDNVPARPDFISRASDLSINGDSGKVGASLFTETAMVRMTASFELASARTLEFQAIGGSDRRLLVDGALVAGPLALALGSHSVEVRFAVSVLGDLPAYVDVLEAGVPVSNFYAGIVHNEQNVPPVIHAMPTIGTDLGGNRIVIEGFGFFPEDQTVVHWGSTDLAGSQLDKWSGEGITLTTPPGSGTVQVTVETPQGVSNSVDYVYSPTGPVPVRFDVLASKEAFVADVTSAAWGPDERLYVMTVGGGIFILTFDDTWTITSIDGKLGVSGLTNRDTLSVAFNPYDVYDPQDPSSIKMYVAHGEQFQNGGGAFTGPSYFTGQVSVLAGPDFNNPQPLITNLPVSNHDHSVNGMFFDDNGDLMICVGGNTNAGVRFHLLGDVPESPLSGAIVRARTSKVGFNGVALYEDTATGVWVDDQVFGEQVDVAAGLDIEVYSPGFRNAFDLVLHTNGYIYATDNGPNVGYGFASTGLDTDTGVHPWTNDELNLIEPGVYYGGANRNRGRYDARQLIYRSALAPTIPGEYRAPMTEFTSSTNGIVEYRAAAFNSAMRGDLVAMKWNSGLYRVGLSEDGRMITSKELFDSPSNTANLPNRGLDVVAGPGGALIAIDYSSGRVRVQVPIDVAAIGLTPYDITPWRVPASGGQNFVIGGRGFGTSLAQVSVTVGGMPATLTSVSDGRIRGVYPASPSGGASELLDVVVTIGSSTRTIEKAARYLPALPGMAVGVWRDGPDLPIALGEVASIAVDGQLYVFGQGDSRTFAYDMILGTWETTLAQRPFPGNHHAVEVFDGKVYLMGGLDNGSAGQVQIYDPVLDAWTLGAPMTWNAGSCISALIGGEIYVGGGILQSAGTAGNFAKYDPVLDSWTAIGAMPIAVNHAASATDGERLFVFGGRQGMNVPQAGFDEVQIYDPVLDTWLTSTAGDVAAMPLPRGGTGRAIFTGGEFMIFGGEDQTVAFAEVQAYDPIADTWRAEKPMPTPRHGIFPALYEGRIFVFGGGLVAGFGYSDVGEIFSPR